MEKHVRELQNSIRRRIRAFFVGSGFSQSVYDRQDMSLCEKPNQQRNHRIWRTKRVLQFPRVFFSSILPALLIAGCSPLKTSPHDEKHQLELTLHEVQTNLDDLRHNVSCFQTEMQIFDGRIKYYENTLVSLKSQDLQNALDKISQLGQQLHLLEKKLSSYEKTQLAEGKNVEKLASHSQETSLALMQFKNRLHEIEQDTATLSRIKDHLESLAEHLNAPASPFKIYKVSPGDSLEKIAKLHRTTVQKLKECNQLQQEDFIVIGQELKIPTG